MLIFFFFRKNYSNVTVTHTHTLPVINQSSWPESYYVINETLKPKKKHHKNIDPMEKILNFLHDDEIVMIINVTKHGNIEMVRMYVDGSLILYLLVFFIFFRLFRSNRFVYLRLMILIIIVVESVFFLFVIKPLSSFF